MLHVTLNGMHGSHIMTTRPHPYPAKGVVMARRRNVRYWASRKGGGFFTTIDGRQVELALGPNDEACNGPTYQRAMQRWLDLECGHLSPDEMTFRGVYLAYVE